MILVDTSVWIEHLRKGQSALTRLRTEAEVLIHPFIIGELSCASLKNRERILTDLNALPSVDTASHREVCQLLEDRRLWGRGIGWIDSHLLASALISNSQFWTLDKKLNRLARETGVPVFRATSVM